MDYMAKYKFLEKENWFKHSFRSREDKKLIRLKMKYQSSAPIGIFWQLCEMIYESAGLLDYDLDVISYNCGDKSELVEDVIKSCFIITDDNKLTHETIIEQLDIREVAYVEMVADKSKAGKASAAAKRLAKELQQSNTHSTGVKQTSTNTQHNSTRVESREIRVESRELRDKDKLAAKYYGPDTPVIEDTDVDYMIDETDIELTRPMLERIIDKFISIDGRFKFQSVMSEINEDYGGFDNLIEMYLPNDTSAQNNFKKQLQQYKNGIYA
jgi:ribosomal protein L19E